MTDIPSNEDIFAKQRAIAAGIVRLAIPRIVATLSPEKQQALYAEAAAVQGSFVLLMHGDSNIGAEQIQSNFATWLRENEIVGNDQQATTVSGNLCTKLNEYFRPRTP